MTENKENFEPFDFYRTGMGFYWTETDFLWRNANEELIKLSDYGITKDDVYNYTKLIKKRREEAKARHTIYEHRCIFFKALAILFLVLFFFYIIGYFNDFMRDTGWIFDVISVPVYIGLIWILYRYGFRYIVVIIERARERLEELHKFPIDGHPDGYDSRIEKYFNDLLWKLHEQKDS